MSPLDAPDVAEEVATFTEDERALALQYYEINKEDGTEEGECVRNAVASILRDRRFAITPAERPTAKQYREMFFWYDNYKKTMSEEEADKKAWQRIMKPTKP